jgi:carbon-monoxide dehydrogenase small subunit
MSTHELRVTVNGAEHAITVPANRMLVDLLRDDLGLTGTKLGCSIGVCGVCSVLVDDELVSSCLVPAVFVDGRSVTTVEGVGGPGGELSPLQESFVRHGGFQCGICTPGQLIAATALLAEVPRPTEAEVRGWMKGNLCRCTGYYKIIESIQAAADKREAITIADAE